MKVDDKNTGQKKKQQWPSVTQQNLPSGSVRWRVDGRYMMNGETWGRRRWFDNHAEAKEAARLLRIAKKNEGARSLSLTREQFADFDRAEAALAPFEGVSLAEAAECHARHLASRAALDEASVREVVDEFLASPEKRAKGGCSPRYEKDLSSRLNRFAEDFGEQTIGEVTTARLDDWLADIRGTTKGLPSFGEPVSAQTRANYRRVLGVLFNFAKKRGHIGENPVTATAQSPARESEIGILTPDDTEALLMAASDSIRASIAIGAFAGLRLSEREGLDWQEVDVENRTIEVLARNAKSARRRIVKISENLAAWLTPLAKESGPVTPPKQIAATEFKAARKAAGFGSDSWLSKEERENGVTLKPWPQNALRHSYASYHVAHHKNAAELAFELGHSGNPQMLFGHYRQVVKPAEAAKFWNIFPGNCGIAVPIKMSA
jgi:integrase